MSSFYNVILNDEEEDLQSRRNVDKWIFRLFLLLLGVMPLIVLASTVEVISPLISNASVLQSGIKGDLFTHYKALFLLVITVIVSGLFLAKIFFMNGTICKTFLNYVLGAFVIAIVVSTIMSPNITIALNGQYNRSEGAISWLCYIALMFIAMNIKYPKNVVRSIMYVMMPFVYINLYIITMNFYGKDLLQKEWVQKFVSLALPQGASIGEGSILVGTLNQWNYMSGMFAMMTVMYLAWAIMSKKWVEIIVGAITASASVAILFMSISTSGFLTIIVVLPVLLLIILKNSEKRMSLIALGVFIVIVTPVFHILSEKNDRVWLESFGFFIDSNPYSKEEAESVSTNLNLQFSFTDKVYASEQILELPVLPERSLAFGTGRGYIWSETLELVKERPLIGYGSDSLVYNFPHYQLESRAGMLDENTIVDKTHNIYLAVLYGTGILGFFALIIIVVWNAILVLGTILRKNTENNLVLILGIAMFAYSVQALFNDSIPAITTIAFVFIGITLSNFNKNELEKDK
ncbi:O-antigen ligase family protein [Lysinibacillus sp. LZ02]|uniref:O-antigen ligase family protein n=1 Tax=Lysinibacillus sp. LZ02 TaxID=3420668 RepID=UPI003D3669C0